MHPSTPGTRLICGRASLRKRDTAGYIHWARGGARASSASEADKNSDSRDGRGCPALSHPGTSTASGPKLPFVCRPAYPAGDPELLGCSLELTLRRRWLDGPVHISRLRRARSLLRNFLHRVWIGLLPPES